MPATGSETGVASRYADGSRSDAVAGTKGASSASGPADADAFASRSAEKAPESAGDGDDPMGETEDIKIVPVGLRFSDGVALTKLRAGQSNPPRSQAAAEPADKTPDVALKAGHRPCPGCGVVYNQKQMVRKDGDPPSAPKVCVDCYLVSRHQGKEELKEEAAAALEALREAQRVTRRSKGWRESYANTERLEGQSYRQWRKSRLAYAQDFVSCFLKVDSFRQVFIKLMETTERSQGLTTRIQEAQLELLRLQKQVPTEESEIAKWVEARKVLSKEINQLRRDLAEEERKMDPLSSHPDGARMHAALQYDDRLVYTGPARVVQKLDPERAAYAEEFRQAATIRDVDMVADEHGELQAPETLPQYVRDAVANLPPAPAAPAPVFANAADPSAFASRYAEKALGSEGAVATPRDFASCYAEKSPGSLPPPPPPYAPPAHVVGGGGVASELEQAGEHVNEFYRCPNRQCGFYASSRLWQTGFAGGKQVWYCGIQWPDFALLFPDAYQRVIARFGSGENANYALCCAQKYKPWARGSACILEFRRPSGQWGCVVAELMPPALQQAMLSCKLAFYKGLDSMTADDVAGCCPVVVPKLNLVQLDHNTTLPGIGKIDVEAYERAGHPVMDEVGWWRFARAIAEKNLELLKPVFDRASAELSSRNIPNLIALDVRVEQTQEEIDAFWAQHEAR